MPLSSDITHIAFADESNWNQGRYRSIALVSAEVDYARTLHKQLDAMRRKSGKVEFKWRSTIERAGIALADFFFEHCEKLRVDVLIWDIEDPRHKGVRHRDDKANFARMYYHLLHNVLKRCWPDGARWLICPDEQKEVDWLTLENCLSWKSWAFEEDLLTVSGEVPAWQDFYNIQEIRLVDSKTYVLVQLADLFAGLAAYSYIGFEKYLQWRDDGDATPSFFTDTSWAAEKLELSNSDKQRLPILHHVRQEAGKRKFQVSLKSSSGLSTKKPIKPLNFWLYTPQHANDMAPVKRTQHYPD